MNADYNDVVEYAILNSIDLPSVQLLLKEIIEADTMCIGYYAHCLLDNENSKKMIGFKDIESLKGILQDTSNIFCTNFKMIRYLFENQKLSAIKSFIKNKFVFFAPILHKGNKLSLIWEKGFSKSEIDNGVYSKWFTNTFSNTTYIDIINYCAQGVCANLMFKLWSPDENSCLEIEINNINKRYCFRDGWISESIDVLMLTGINSMKFCYTGNAVNSNNGDIRTLKFVISDLQISTVTGDIYCHDKVYNNKNNSTLYDYMMTDELIRGVLHSSGFFEVESFHGCIKANTDKSTSRYLVSDQIYHSLTQNDVEEDDLVLYVANRKGRLNVNGI